MIQIWRYKSIGFWVITLTKTLILIFSYYALLKNTVTSRLPQIDPVVTEEEMTIWKEVNYHFNQNDRRWTNFDQISVYDPHFSWAKMFHLSKHQYLDMFWYFLTI